MRISVVIPTHQRRDLVVGAVLALARQVYVGPFEVIVVVDGSTDGTEDALRRLETPFQLTVLTQSNQGAAAARTAGGFAARGEILLFLDDDMEADPELLAAHDRAHRAGASVVIGHIPLHPDSPPGLLGTWVGRWVDHRKDRLSQPGAVVRVMDLVGGQISVSRAAFEDVGGFDRKLTDGGTYGHEDVEFGYRLLQRGHTAVFEPQAVSWQRYSVRPLAFLRQARQSGRGSVMFARKHPELANLVMQRAVNRRLYRGLATIPLLARMLRSVAVMLVDRGVQSRLTERVLFAAQSLEFCTGLRESGGMPRPRPLRVLAYHAIEPRQATGRFAPYEIQPGDFRQQIESLLRAGYHFVSASEVLQFLRGSGGLPRRPLLLTFDDCYLGVLEHALPVLREYRIPAVAFAVTGFLGRDNAWSMAAEGARLPLLDAEGLRRLARAGVEIGAHSRTHPVLPRLTGTSLIDEVTGSCDALRTMGLGAARLFSYPYGESDEQVRSVVRAAGCEAAFTVVPGVVRARSDPFALPRIEILRGDRGWRFLWKVFVAGALREPRQGRAAIVRTVWRRWAVPTLRARRAAAKSRVAFDGGMHGTESGS